jgi:hypothetical protein
MVSQMKLSEVQSKSLNLYTLEPDDCLNRAMNQTVKDLSDKRKFRPLLVFFFRSVLNTFAPVQQTQSYTRAPTH